MGIDKVTKVVLGHILQWQKDESIGIIEMLLKNDRIKSLRIDKKDKVLEVVILGEGKISGKMMYYKSSYSQELIITNIGKHIKHIVDSIFKDFDAQEVALLAKDKTIKLQ